MYAGDAIATALSVVGITDDRIERWLGQPCKCPERREKLNSVDAWARRVVSGKVERAIEYLDRIMS